MSGSAIERDRALLRRCAAAATADGCGDREAGHGPLVLGLAAPEAVLEVGAGVAAALEQHRAGLADPPGSRFTLHPGLRPLGVRSEERVGLAAACGERHPDRRLPEQLAHRPWPPDQRTR